MTKTAIGITALAIHLIICILFCRFLCLSVFLLRRIEKERCSQGNQQ